MSEHSRRSFLKRASVGAAVVGAGAVVPLAVANPAGAATESDAERQVPVTGRAHEGSFTVWVKNAASGEISVLVGESEVIHHDKALARKLARLAARGA